MFTNINKVIKVIIYWDIAINSAWGFLGPVFAIFLVQVISVGSAIEGAKVAGIASLFYWITKSIFQIPIGRYLDKNHGEVDDFWFSFIGTVLTGLVPFGFLFSSAPWHIYAFQVVHAIGMSMIVPSAYAVFTRHIDKGKESYEWGLDSTLLGIGVGVTGALGGVMTASFGFQTIFILTGFLTIASAFLWFLIREDMSKTISPTHNVPPPWPY